jgi:hypothetical protein
MLLLKLIELPAMFMIMKRIIIPVLLLLIPFSLLSQTGNKETKIQREVTLYNPFKPSLQDATKKSYLPDMTDTSHVSPDFKYDITSISFMPVYSISTIKAASLLADPLPKLYKSYINAGFGNYTTPLAEISIASLRSKKGAIGIYVRHLSSNGKVKLYNDKRVFAGYMDNEASLFGKKFLKKSIIESSIDFNQFTRYAYGYDTSMINYNPPKKDIRFNYLNTGGNIGLISTNLDSSSLSYDFRLKYIYFYQTNDLWQHNFELTGFGAKEYKDFYVGSGLDLSIFKSSPFLNGNIRKVISLSPFVSKRSALWSFKLGIQILAETSQENLLSITTTEDNKDRVHLYPDLNFSFNIVPAYLDFFAALNGKLENNKPLKIINENPFLPASGILYNLPNTDHELIVIAGFQGSTGTEGSYLLSASYSVINDMILYKNNHVLIEIPPAFETGNLFIPALDNAELLNIHGELKTEHTEKISAILVGNYYYYTLTSNDFAWNKPAWDAKLGVKYNLRNKILAGAEFTATGGRKASIISYEPSFPSSGIYISKESVFDMPSHFNLNLSAEYRYTKILSFWVKLNNISYNRYDEWLFYPSMRFMGMVGFTYSL